MSHNHCNVPVKDDSALLLLSKGSFFEYESVTNEYLVLACVCELIALGGVTKTECGATRLNQCGIAAVLSDSD